MRLTSALDSIYVATQNEERDSYGETEITPEERDHMKAVAANDDDDFEEEAAPEEISPLVSRGRPDRGWTPPKENPFEWQRTYLHGMHPELRHDNGNRQLIHVVDMPDGTFATHQILSPDAPTNPTKHWRVNRFFHDQNGQVVPFTDEHGNTVFSESTDHPSSEEAGDQYLSNREWDRFRSAGWARPNRDEMRYTKFLEGDPKIMLHAELVNTAGNEDLEIPERWTPDHYDDDRGVAGRSAEAWKVSAYRVRRGPSAEEPHIYEHIGTRYHPDAESAIAGVKGRRTLGR